MMRASIMRDVQREQRGRSMGVSDGREEKEARTLSLHLGGSVQHSQSPIAAEGGAVMWHSRMSGTGYVVDIARIGKVHEDE
jgi:hypothetical protein